MARSTTSTTVRDRESSGPQQATLPGPPGAARGAGGGGTPRTRVPQPKALQEILEKAQDRLAEALPRHLTPERLIQVVTAINYRTPKLQQCDPSTILAAVIQGSALGLDFTPTLGEAYLIPRWNKEAINPATNAKGVNECQFQPGYRGLAKLARQSGDVDYLHARLVHAADIFDYRFTPELQFNHVPHLGPDRGDVTHVYCVAKLSSGEHLIDVMTVDEIEGIHHRSESYKSALNYNRAEIGPWASDWGEMARKTVLKRLVKSLPMSASLDTAIQADNHDYEAHGPDANVGQAVATVKRGSVGLASRLGLDGPSLPPQPSVVYSEADDPSEPPYELDGAESGPDAGDGDAGREPGQEG